MNTPNPGDSMKPPRPSRAARRRSQRGAAYAETVVMLPFFIIVWSCIIYVHNAYSEKVRLMAQNRNCVMAYAYNACSSPPAGCTVGPGAGAGGAPGEVDSFVGALGSFGSGLLSTLTGGSVTSRMNTSVAKPRVLGGGSTSVLAGNTMQCNTRYQDNPVRAVGAAFCSFVGIGC